MKIKEIGLVNSLRMNYHYFGWGGGGGNASLYNCFTKC